MLDNGWEEVVARQALLGERTPFSTNYSPCLPEAHPHIYPSISLSSLPPSLISAQWSMDQRKSVGTNTTVPRDVLDSIRPSLKRQNDTTTSTNKAKAGAATGSAGVKEKAPTPAKKEDCVFEVTSENFQKVVLESPVPVLVDVYADWCGPCKQLGPMLESAAMKSGGMFRLAKVNSDKESSLAQTLEVQGLPTVFACNAGMLFVYTSMIPSRHVFFPPSNSRF